MDSKRSTLRDAGQRRFADSAEGGSFGGFPSQRAQGEVCYSWWEGITYEPARLMLHAGREVDIVERLQLTEDETKLIFEFEMDIYAEGRDVKLKSTADGNPVP